MMMCRFSRLLYSSLIVYCMICINNNVIVVNAAEDGDENNENENENNDGDGDGDVVGVGVVPFMNDEISSCIDSTVDFFINNPNIENECDTYADTYSQIDNGQDSEGNNIMELGYPDESLKALESICTTNNGYWITTTSKLEFTCLIMEIETIKVIVNNYGECLANTDECHNTNISVLMEGMFADMDFACYEGDTPPDNFNDIVDEIDSEYFQDDDIFGPGDDDEYDGNDDYDANEDDDYEVDDLFEFGGDDLSVYDDDEEEMMEELKDGLPEDDDDDDDEEDDDEDEENEVATTSTRPPATSSNTAETSPVEGESSPTLYGGGDSGAGDESGLEDTTNGLPETLDNKDTNDGNGSSSSTSTSTTNSSSSYNIMTGIVIFSCIVIAVVGFITHSHYTKKNKRRTGGKVRQGRRGSGSGGRHQKLSQQIGYEMTEINISSSGRENNNLHHQFD